MAQGLHSNEEYGSALRELKAKTPDELMGLIEDRFEDFYPSEGLYSGTYKDRVWQFALNRVKATCNDAASLGEDVWKALNDEHTAHNVERFALVCGFFASHIFPHAHWPAHEIAALVLLIISVRPKEGGQK